MTTRLLAVALAFVMTGAPVLTTVCEAACAAHTTASHARHHSCHAEAPSHGVGITGLAHNCGHSDGDDQIGADQAVKLLLASTVAVTGSTFSLSVVKPSARLSDRRAYHSPPGKLALATQLRV